MTLEAGHRCCKLMSRLGESDVGETCVRWLQGSSCFKAIENGGYKHGLWTAWVWVPASTIYMWINGEGNGNPLQYSCLANPMDRGAWWAAVHGVAKSRTQLSDFTFTFHFHASEKAMATHSSVLAWRITGTAEPGGLPSMGSHRVGHNWSNLAAVANLSR